MGIPLKSLFRDLVPATLQVPTKYWMDQAWGFAEPEMALLRRLLSKGDRLLDVGGNHGV